MENTKNTNKNKRYTLATRDISLQDFIIMVIMVVLMVVWVCLITDKRFIFIPLFFLLIPLVLLPSSAGFLYNGIKKCFMILQ